MADPGWAQWGSFVSSCRSGWPWVLAAGWGQVSSTWAHSGALAVRTAVIQRVSSLGVGRSTEEQAEMCCEAQAGMLSFQVCTTGQVYVKGLRVTLPLVGGTAKSHDKGGNTGRNEN